MHMFKFSEHFCITLSIIATSSALVFLIFLEVLLTHFLGLPEETMELRVKHKVK